MYVLSRKEMQFYDSLAINNFKIPSRILMENAGKGCSNFIENEYSEDIQKIIVFCGSGNNGGDGFVVARWLKNFGKQVVVIQLDNEEKMSDDTMANYELLRRLEIPIFKTFSYQDWININMNLRNFDLIVDAIFGIGFSGELTNWKKNLISEINAVTTSVVSLDVASGIDINTGTAENAIQANHTLTMSDYKFGHFIGKGRLKSGDIHKINIGIPFKIYEKYKPHAELVEQSSIQYPKRELFKHKGNYGRVGIIAGSAGLSGAAIMASRAALKSGAGLITLYHSDELNYVYENQLLEIMTKELAEKDSEWDLKQIMQEFEKLDALLVGPGWGVNDKNKKLLEEILWTWKKPLVLDADALNIIAENSRMMEMFKKNDKIVITPHYGEFAKLLHKSIQDLITDPIGYSIKFSKKYKVRLLLKSISTIFTDGKHT
ncbi:MAG: NAD(P)H-hydrate epimerase, partial [Candidatus Cloacimonadota bacterium]|nr:NAD(P)H-hydrate epimerase [Candidatus Cloacimonadota bacterium]